MMKYYFGAILLLIFTNSFAQSKPFEISGKLISEDDQTPLEAATVYLQRVKDSSLITYTISDRDGKFLLEDKTSEISANLYVSYVGYQTYFKLIDLKKSTIDLDTIQLKISTNSLNEIVIKAQAPITIKKDTLEFNVKSFDTKKDANVEDLLKVLPGVEVAEDGSITVNGKSVNKILVNGKPFFGNDPTITTRNLSKEIIEKIQVVDTKTKAQAFSGEKVDNENKTINLTIKKENNKGNFGKLSAGTGTDKRYEFAGMLNHFDNNQRISVLAGGNNTNSPGFSFGEIRKMFGGNSIRFNSNGSFSIDGRSFGGGQGITTSRNYGLNFADKLGEKKDVSADYFYSKSSSNNETIKERENILPDSRFFTKSNTSNYNDSDSHRANMEFDIEVDSTFLINVRPRFSYGTSETVFSQEESSLNDSNVLTNDNTSNSLVNSINRNFNNDIDVTKRFGKNGAFLRFSIGNEIKTDIRKDFLNSISNIYGDTPQNITRDQFADVSNKDNNFSSEIRYRLPLIGKELFFDAEYNYQINKSENIRNTFDKDSATDEFSLFNTDLSTDFKYLNEQMSPELTLRYRTDIWDIRLGSGYVFRTLENHDRLRPELDVKRRFKNLQWRSNIEYKFSAKSKIELDYRLRNNPPRVNQLQAYRDVSNPLNIRTGNPDLKPTDIHQATLRFRSFDWQKGTGIFSYFRANFEDNRVVSKTTTDENFVRETTYANVNGNYDIYGNVSLRKSVKIDSLRTIRFGVNLSGSINRAINYNNDIQYASNVKSLNPSVDFRLTWKDVFEISPRYRLSFTRNTYEIDTFKDIDFLYHVFELNTATFLPKHFEWRNDISYNYNPNIAEGFQKSAWFWNSTLAYSFLKDNVTLTLKAYDLLNQNTNARRVATENYIEDSQSTVLTQYFMLSFSWKFNTLGPKGETRERHFRRF
tara:strand:+ start:4167 stop:6944 length:2778 start_codon:yes stop_codon:yes gene_type:complete